MEKSRIDLPIGITLDRFIKNNQSEYPNAVGELSQLLSDIALASKVVNREINKAGLIDIMGDIGTTNAAGDQQQKLDLLANTRFTRALTKGGVASGIASEETSSFLDLNNRGKYIVTIDPLDGSSNIDVNVSIGTIFSIYKRLSPISEPLTNSDFLQKGRAQIAAGYVLYGVSTMLVFSTGNGVNGFTYESTIGEYVLSHPDIKYNNAPTYYSINEGLTFDIIDKGVIDYLHNCKEKRISARYIGSLVADFHRNLLNGGIFLYPRTKQNPEGKLRILFEANALAFIAEQTGGLCVSNDKLILDIQPTEIHQTVPFYVGSKAAINELLDQIKSTSDDLALSTLHNNNWSKNKNKLEKIFKFNDYAAVITFVNQVMQIANNQNHHPEINVHFNFVTIFITDYESGGISEKCHLFIKAVDKILLP